MEINMKEEEDGDKSDGDSGEEEMELHASSGDKSEGEEQAVCTICSHATTKNHRTIKYKGSIENIPMCALIDFGSTHSFLNPAIFQNLAMTAKITDVLNVKIAYGRKMVTNQVCNATQFTLLGTKFEADLRLLEVEGHDVVLGIDWLSTLGETRVNWKLGTMKFKYKGKEREPVTVKLQVCNQELDISKEQKKGSQVLVAQLFSMEQELRKAQTIQDEGVRNVLESY